MVTPPEDRPNPIQVHDMMFAWQVLALFFCEWWGLAMQSFHHDFRPAHPPGSQEDEGQLAVPEPIEEDGDALFA